nr:beta-1,4-glucuronyltransferase 1 [Ipomoea batatas]
MNDPEALDDPEAVGGLKTAANLEALGVKAKHKSHGVKAKHKFRATWNQKVEDDLEYVNDPEAAKHKFHGVKAKHKFRGCEAPKQDQVELGTQKVEDDLEAVNDPEALDDPEAVENDLEAVSDLEAVNDPEALDDPEVVDDPEEVADPRTVGSHALSLNPQSRPNGTPPWRTRASATQHSKAGNPRHHN